MHNEHPTETTTQNCIKGNFIELEIKEANKKLEPMSRAIAYELKLTNEKVSTQSKQKLNSVCRHKTDGQKHSNQLFYK